MHPTAPRILLITLILSSCTLHTVLGNNPTEGTTDTCGATSEPTTTDPTDGGTDTTAPQIPDQCSALCVRKDECMFATDPDCAEECTDDFDFGGDDACVFATKVYLGCLLDMTCEQLAALTEDDDVGDCGFESLALEATCPHCSRLEGRPDGEGTQCTATLACDDAPELKMQCDTTTCACFSGPDKTGECPAEGACMDLDALSDKSLACCGF